MPSQRIFQIATGYEDGNDSNSLRHDPMFRLGAGRKPFDPSASRPPARPFPASNMPQRPTGAENAMILKRMLKLIRQHFPDTHILVRGDGYFSNPELIQLIDAMPNTDFIFGLASNTNLLRSAEPILKQARALYAQCQAFGDNASVRLYDEFQYAAGSGTNCFG